MEKIVILYSNRVENYLKNLIDILFLGEYFGFEESAVKYVEKIYDAIEEKIHLNQFKPSPKELQKHGKFYIVNKRTNWYIFFNRRENRFLIKYITNNHMPDAQFL